MEIVTGNLNYRVLEYSKKTTRIVIEYSQQHYLAVMRVRITDALRLTHHLQAYPKTAFCLYVCLSAMGHAYVTPRKDSGPGIFVNLSHASV